MLREIATRFGREGLGFFWLVGEPLLFCVGVIVLWTFMKPAYEYGVRVGPFVMTGYMCLILLRHQLSYSINAMAANIGLMYHRQVKPVHIFVARGLIETCGTTLAFFIVYSLLLVLGQVGPPKDWGLLYNGWFSLAFLAFGMGLTMSTIAIRFETFERLTQLIMYLLIPLSGAFFMASIVPPKYREQFLLIPLPNSIEMVRAGVFGEFVETHYHPVYPWVWAGGMILLGLLLLKLVRGYIEIE